MHVREYDRCTSGGCALLLPDTVVSSPKNVIDDCVATDLALLESGKR